MRENVYYDPEKFGLTVVGEVDDPGASYSFDKFVVWRAEDGTLYWDQDSGCSCPSPFEDVRSLSDLKTGDSDKAAADALEWAEGFNPDVRGYGSESTYETAKADAHALIRKL